MAVVEGSTSTQDQEQATEKLTAGVFLIDKPVGQTSFSIVRQVRRLLSIKKVGHAGTLDPFASGLLIVCVGRPATRLIDRFMTGKKVYRGLLQLGVETETQDPEGTVCKTTPVPDLMDENIRTCLAGFVGRQMQVPPPYSAAKHKGKPLYYYARKGITVQKDPKEIEIYALKFLRYDAETHQLEIEVCCSRGTYIRVLAADIGRELGCGAYLHELRRLGSGPFSVTESLSGKELKDQDGQRKLKDAMISIERAMAVLDAVEEDDKEAVAVL